MTLSRLIPLLFLSAMLGLSGCSAFKPREEAPKTGSLTQRLTLVDAENRQYGVVELDPVNGGKLFDVQGKLLGYVVPPAPIAAAITTPVAPVPVTPTIAPIGALPQPVR